MNEHVRIRPAPVCKKRVIDPMPGSIAKAICTVQRDMEAVKKSQYNSFAKYNFASADDIYAAVARKFAQVGLVIYPLELTRPKVERLEFTDNKGITKISQWGSFHFGYMLATEQDSWFDEGSARSIFIQLTGPQTFNAAESFCQKQYLRGLLKLPTGDMDLDSLAQGDTLEDQVTANAAKPKTKRKSSAAAKRDGDDKEFNEIKQLLENAGTRDELSEINRKFGGWQDMPRAWAEILDETYEQRFDAATARETA